MLARQALYYLSNSTSSTSHLFKVFYHHYLALLESELRSQGFVIVRQVFYH
jgi:hypothetical protein